MRAEKTYDPDWPRHLVTLQMCADIGTPIQREIARIARSIQKLIAPDCRMIYGEMQA